MKRKLYLLLGLLVALQMPLLTSCNDDDEDIMPTQVPAEVTAALTERYPSATPKWEKGKGLYKAEFYNESGEVDVWFKANGEWVMTQTDIFPQNLPEAVKNYVATNYPDRIIDDADRIETPTADYYLLELDKPGAKDIYIKLTPGGELIP